MSLNHVQREDK